MRTAASGFLLFLTCLIALAAVPVNWVDQQLHSDAYGDTARRVLEDPEIRGLISRTITDGFVESGSIPPEAAADLQARTDAVLASEAAVDTWETMNLTARDTLLSGSGGVVVDFTELIELIAADLPPEYGAELAGEIPADLRGVEILDASDVGPVRDVADAIGLAGIGLPLLALVLLGLAVLVARRRLVALAGGAFGIALTMLIVLVAVGVGTGRVASEAGDNETGQILGALLDASTGSLRAQILLVLVVALIVGAGAVVGEIVLRRRSAPTELPPGGGYPGHPGYPGHGHAHSGQPTHPGHVPGYQPAPAGAGYPSAPAGYPPPHGGQPGYQAPQPGQPAPYGHRAGRPTTPSPHHTPPASDGRWTPR